MNNPPWHGREVAKHSAPRQARGRKLFCPPPRRQGANLIDPA
jgi:hypothetical protein